MLWQSERGWWSLLSKCCSLTRIPSWIIYQPQFTLPVLVTAAGCRQWPWCQNIFRSKVWRNLFFIRVQSCKVVDKIRPSSIRLPKLLRGTFYVVRKVRIMQFTQGRRRQDIYRYKLSTFFSLLLYILTYIRRFVRGMDKIKEGRDTLWLYQLLQKHLLICCTKLHYIDLYGPLLSLSHIDIWYLVSNNPEICQKRWKMTFRKKGKIFRVGSNWPII